MRIYAYTAVTAILVGLLAGIGYLYATKQIQNADSILMYIIAQVMTVWVGLTNKIFRITNHTPSQQKDAP